VVTSTLEFGCTCHGGKKTISINNILVGKTKLILDTQKSLSIFLEKLQRSLPIRAKTVPDSTFTVEESHLTRKLRNIL